MFGRTAPPHIGHRKLAAMMAQETTPDISKAGDGAPARLPFDHDVLTTPSKRGGRTKHLMEDDQQLEGSAGKKVCLSLENSCVRRPLIVLLSGLKADPDHLKSSTAHSDQVSAGKSKYWCKTSLSPASTHSMPKISSKLTPVVSLKEGTAAEKSATSSELNCANMNLVVQLVRLREESEKLVEKDSEGTSEKDPDQQNGSSMSASSSTSATSTHISSTEKVLRRSLRTKKIQSDPLKEEAKISLEADCAANLLPSSLNVNPQIVEERESMDESDSEEVSDQSSAAKNNSWCKISLFPASTHIMKKISNKSTPVVSLKDDTVVNKSDKPSELSCENMNLVVQLVRLREESEKLVETVSQGTSKNDPDQQNGSSMSASSSTSASRTRSSSTEKGLRRSLRAKKLQSDPLEEEADSAANLSNLNVNPQILDEKESTDESDREEESDQEHMELSAYERERLKNIKENAKFLKSIKLLESAASLHPPKRKSIVKREKPQNTESTVVRRSMRLKNVTPTQVTLEEQAPIVEENVRLMKPPGPIEMIPVSQKEDRNAMDQFLKMWASVSQETAKTPKNMHAKALKSYEKCLERMTLRTEDVAKVVPGRILSVAIHPSESQTLVATGDKYGTVGLWNLDGRSGDEEIYTFGLHSRHVGCLSFCPWNSAHLLSLSYDGTVRCGDVTRSVFDEIYRDEDENFSSFDFLSADGSVLIVSHWDSQLSLVDRRTPGTTYELRTPVDVSGPRTVSVHPMQRDLCVVAGAGNVCVYDVRQISQKKLRSVVSLPEHMKVVFSAYFSPFTGNRILTTCADDRLRVFDSSSLGSTVPLLTSVRHNNFTGRWLSRFRAVWDPKQEDCFIVGSMERPRQIQVYHEEGKLVHVFWDADNLNSVCSINAMHPTRNILVGGNSSGRLHVFRD